VGRHNCYHGEDAGYAALTVRFRQYIPDVYNLVIV
jgi:hypothetical protein